MEIYIPNKRLRTLADDLRMCQKELGTIEAKIYLRRLDQLRNASTLEDVRHLPGHFHELKDNRKGQWACDLDQPNRLIFEPHESPIPEDASGKYIWIEIKSIDITEITNYHGK